MHANFAYLPGPPARNEPEDKASIVHYNNIIIISSSSIKGEMFYMVNNYITCVLLQEQPATVDSMTPHMGITSGTAAVMANTQPTQSLSLVQQPLKSLVR